MSDFKLPQYNSYVRLCGTMRHDHGEWYGLPHELCMGDWYTHESTPYTPRLYMGEENTDMVVWLPQLSDWLAMMQEKGASGFVVWRRDEGWIARPVNGPAIDYDSEYYPEYHAETPEEAVGRLWLVYEVAVSPTSPDSEWPS